MRRRQPRSSEVQTVRCADAASPCLRSPHSGAVSLFRWLAPRAEIRRLASYAQCLQGAMTPGTHAVLFARTREVAFGQPVQVMLGARPAGHSGLQHFARCVEELARLLFGEVFEARTRVNPRLEQDLIGVDVADAGYAPLIHQSGLERSRAVKRSLQRGQIESGIERIGAEAVSSKEHVGFAFFGQADLPLEL